MKSKKLSGISRIDSGATHGWFVRAYREGRTHSKFFSDLKNKGKNKALHLALDYRDKLRARLGPRLPSARIMKSNSGNTSGVVGVSRTKRKSATGKISEYFTVSWRPEPNIAKNKSFAISPGNEAEIFQKAVKFRKAKEREIQTASKNLRISKR